MSVSIKSSVETQSHVLTLYDHFHTTTHLSGCDRAGVTQKPKILII